MEWNQPMTREKRGGNGVLLTGEVFQIGAVRLREDGSRDGAFCENVSLRFYHKLHYHVRKICGMKERDLEGCRSFPEVARDFAAFWGDDGVLFSWGPDDVPMLRDNLKAYGVTDVAIPAFYDLQKVYAAQVTHENRQAALEDAMANMGIPHRFNMHNAYADALNTSFIAQQLDLAKGIRDLEEQERQYRLYNVHLDGFSSVRAALGAPALRKLKCPLCRRDLTGKVETVPRTTRAYRAACPEHGLWQYRIKVSRNSDLTFHADPRIRPYPEPGEEETAPKAPREAEPADETGNETTREE